MHSAHRLWTAVLPADGFRRCGGGRQGGHHGGVLQQTAAHWETLSEHCPRAEVGEEQQKGSGVQ